MSLLARPALIAATRRRGVSFLDPFDRPDAPTLGAPYVKLNGGDIGVSSGQAGLAVDAADSHVVRPGDANGTLNVRLAVNQFQTGLLFRVVDATHMWRAVISGSTLFIQVRDGGTFSTIGSASVGRVNNDILKVTFFGPTIKAYRNDVETVSVVNATLLNATLVGVELASATTRLDDLQFASA